MPRLSTAVDNFVDNFISKLMESLDTTMITVWDRAIQSLSGKMSSGLFSAWIQPLSYVDLVGDELIVSAPNRYTQEWFTDNYLVTVQREIERLLGRPLSIRIQVVESPVPESTIPESTIPVPVTRAVEVTASTAPTASRESLNDRYRFGNFVVGPSNQFAQAAAKLVSEEPGRKYNPLFIYGGTGLGKTHLLQAAGHAILDQHPSWKVQYITSERFVNEFITSLRLKRMDDYRARFRDHCDVLLVDDIQFFQGKDLSQEEFFHTFNTLHERHKQIIITSDKVPNQLPDLEERLKSRFHWGLIADILVPEFETRVAILQRKAEQDGIDLSDDVSYYLAQNIQSNVRELEGALIRLAAFSNLRSCTITVEFARDILTHLLTRNRGQITIDRIQREVASFFNVTQKDLKGQRRPHAISYPRQLAMYLARKLTSASLSEIGQQFGGKDHTTVLSADRKVRKLVENDDEVRQTLETLEKILGR